MDEGVWFKSGWNVGRAANCPWTSICFWVTSQNCYKNYLQEDKWTLPPAAACCQLHREQEWAAPAFGVFRAVGRAVSLPSHFIAGLGGAQRGPGHHGHLDGAVLLVHDQVQLLLQGFAGGLQGQQLGLDAVQPQAYGLVDGVQERLRGRRRSRVERSELVPTAEEAPDKRDWEAILKELTACLVTKSNPWWHPGAFQQAHILPDLYLGAKSGPAKAIFT